MSLLFCPLSETDSFPWSILQDITWLLSDTPTREALTWTFGVRRWCPHFNASECGLNSLTLFHLITLVTLGKNPQVQFWTFLIMAENWCQSSWSCSEGWEIRGLAVFYCCSPEDEYWYGLPAPSMRADGVFFSLGYLSELIIASLFLCLTPKDQFLAWASLICILHVHVGIKDRCMQVSSCM